MQEARADLYEAADALIYVLARIAGEADLEALERLVNALPRLTRLLDILEKLDDEKLRALERLLDLAARVGAKEAECIGEALDREPEPVQGLRGILELLRDEEFARGLARAVEIVRALGRC